MAKYITLPVVVFKCDVSDTFSTETYAVIGGKYYWLGYGKILVNVYDSVDAIMKNINECVIYEEHFIKRLHKVKKVPKPTHMKLQVYYDA